MKIAVQKILCHLCLSICFGDTVIVATGYILAITQKK